MKTATIRNFHIPLPEQLYLRLKEAAQRQRRPATQLAKQAVEYWLEEQEKLTLHEEIASYAAEVAGAEEEPMLDWRMREFRLFLRERRSDEAGGGILGGPCSPVGSEQRGRRPVIILSHDAFNQATPWRFVIVIPISTSLSQARRGPTVVALQTGTAGLGSDCAAICHQATTIDRAKRADRIGALPIHILARVEKALPAAVDIRP